MVEVSRSGSARRMIFCRSVRQNTARIDRKVLICRDFVRTVLSWGIDRLWTATECARVPPAYRPLENIAFCRYFCSMMEATDGTGAVLRESPRHGKYPQRKMH
jgi:hypothetical protein